MREKLLVSCRFLQIQHNFSVKGRRNICCSLLERVKKNIRSAASSFQILTHMYWNNSRGFRFGGIAVASDPPDASLVCWRG